MIYGCDKVNKKKKKKININFENKYRNSGFALIYNKNLKNAKKIDERSLDIYHKRLKEFMKYIENKDTLNALDENLKVAIITPDKDIIPDAQTLTPAYVVFDNYEIILKWNRSLRFALAVCTLKDKFKDEL